MGKEILDYKKKQEEEKTKRLLEERNREKAEEKAARERVKQQIALVSRQISDDAVSHMIYCTTRPQVSYCLAFRQTY